MNQYIKFIRHVLWACFFVTFLGLLVQYIVGWNQYVLGWLWGMLTMMVYLVLLGLHNKGLAYGNPHQAVAKARRQIDVAIGSDWRFRSYRIANTRCTS